MKILIGIPTFHRPAMLADLLASLAAQEFDAGLEVEVFVADNDAASKEGQALCQRLADGWRWPLEADVVAEPGISAVRNRILAEARLRRAPLVVMVDDDETVAPGWLEALVCTQRLCSAQVVAGPVLYEFEGEPATELLASGAFPLKRNSTGPVAFVNASGNILFDCAALAALDWPQFDLAFGRSGGEDKEFLTRLKMAGCNFAWADEALAFEHVPRKRMGVRAVMARAFAIGSADYRIETLHGPARARMGHLAKSMAVLATCWLMLPGLLFPRQRLKSLRRIARSSGRISAAFGSVHKQYGKAI
jgi:succinoglycan biosynthesis protein ExoM